MMNEAAATVGEGGFGALVRAVANMRGTAAEDTTAARNLIIEFTLPNTEATDVLTMDFVSAELI